MAAYPLLRHSTKFVSLLLVVISLTSCQTFGRIFGEFQAPRRWIGVVHLTTAERFSIYDGIANYLLKNGFIEKPPLDTDCELYQAKSKRCYIRTFRLPEKEGKYVVGVFLYIDSPREQVVYELEETLPNFPAKSPPVFSPQACGIIANLNAYVISLVGADKLTYGYNGIASKSEPGLTLQKYIGCEGAG